jgi:hypothetical protein
VKGIFSINRRFGAKWAFIEKQDAAHEFEKSKEFTLHYFANVILLRISTGKLNSSHTLNKINSSGYIEVHSDKKVIKEGDKIQNPGITSWLPNKLIT